MWTCTRVGKLLKLYIQAFKLEQLKMLCIYGKAFLPEANDV